MTDAITHGDMSTRPRHPAGDPNACEVCGWSPAIDVSLKRCTGLVFLLRQHRVRRRLCRDCGISIFRDMQAQTLLKGWWSAGSFLIYNWIAVFGNLGEFRRLSRLPPPQRPAGSAPRLRSEPLAVGRPLWQRPQTYAFLPLFALFMGIALVSVVLDQYHMRGPQPVDAANPAASIGRCVQITGTRLDGTVDCSGAHSGVITGTSPVFPTTCPHRTDITFTVNTAGTSVCVDTSDHRT